MLSIQTLAPDFALPNASGQIVTLSNHKGTWVLLYFYPKDDTPGCTKEACAFRDNMPLYEETGITVFGISKDSIESHKKFIEKYKLPFDLLSDTSGDTIRMYDAQNVLSGTKRVSYLIDPKGYIAKVYESVSPATHSQEVLEDLKSLTKK